MAAADTTSIFVGWDGTKYHPVNAGQSIGLALSGGGARGLAQIGVIKALEKSGLRIGAIAGTSIGGIIGGLYASGYSANDLEKIIKTINFGEFFSNRPSRTSMLLTQRPEKDRCLVSIRFDGYKPCIPQALTAGQRLSNLLSRLTLKSNYISGGSFSRLKIPLRVVTTDIVTGNKVVLSEGDLADAMRSTMAFPLAFTGVESGEMLLMDGGMVDPIPVDVLRNIDSNLDLLVAVNTTSDLLPKEKIRNPIDIANQVTSIMTMDKLAAGIKSADIAITPDIAEYNSIDFDKVEELIERGYLAGQEAISDMSQKLKMTSTQNQIYLIDVEIINSPALSDSTILPLRPGQLVGKHDIEETASYLYRTYDLYSVSIEIISNAEPSNSYQEAILKIEMLPKPNKEQLRFIIKGNTVFDDSTIINILKSGNDFLSSEDILMFSDSLIALYEKKGFDLAHIRRLNLVPSKNILEIDIDEAIIEDIEITGNKRTKRWLIKSNFPLRANKPFNSRKAGRGIANIFATDLFDRVTMNITPGENGAIVRIIVKEKKYTQIRLGWHWHDEYRSEEFIEVLDDNLLGTGQELLAHAQYSNRRQNYEVYLKADRFFSTYLTYRIKGFYHILDRKFYDSKGEFDSSIRENRLGLEFILGQQIARFGTVTGEIRWEEIKNKFSPGGHTDIIKLRTITLKSLVETINRYPFPTEGKKHLFYFQFSADILGGETKYTKLYSSVESYFPITERINFHPRISFGHTDAKYGIPISESFYVGGHHSFYGYSTDELVGAKMILGNMELRYKLPYRFYISGRYDFGDVYTTVDQIKLRNLRHGYGISLAYDSPIGPIELGYGKSGKRTRCFYVDIGLAF